MRLIVFAFLAASSAQAQERVAFFGMTLLDTSLQTQTTDQTPPELARITMLDDMMCARFENESSLLVDVEPPRMEIDRVTNVAKYHKCGTRIVTQLGAGYPLIGEVQKVSGLNLAIKLRLRAANTGEMVKGGGGGIRRNTDNSWSRGMRNILKNTIFVQDYG